MCVQEHLPLLQQSGRTCNVRKICSHEDLSVNQQGCHPAAPVLSHFAESDVPAVVQTAPCWHCLTSKLPQGCTSPATNVWISSMRKFWTLFSRASGWHCHTVFFATSNISDWRPLELCRNKIGGCDSLSTAHFATLMPDQHHSHLGKPRSSVSLQSACPTMSATPTLVLAQCILAKRIWQTPSVGVA